MTKESLNTNWQNCLDEIQKSVSFDDFNKWIKPLEVSSFDGAVLLLAVPSKEWAEYIDKNLLSSMRTVLKNEFQGIKKLSYVLSPKEAENKAELSAQNTSFNTSNSTQAITNPFVITGLKKMMIDPQLNFDYNFDSFVAGPCNSLARLTGSAIAKNPGAAAFNPLFVHGDSGMGKTHLVQAVGIEIKKNSPDMNVLYVSMSKFLDQFTAATRKKEVGNFVRFYQMIDVLIIDDIHELTGRPGTQSVLFSIFNHLHITGKQLIFTCDRPPSELKDIENRLITRFKWGITVAIDKPDYETKLKIIASKSRRMNLNLPAEIISFIAKNIDGSVREIEGVISSFVAYTSFLKKEMSMSLAQEIIKSHVSVSPEMVSERKEVTIERIQTAVCSYYNVTKEELFSKTRTKNIAFARQVAMYLSKEMTTLSLKAIGAAYGGKTHATVLHASKTIVEKLVGCKKFIDEIQEIKNIIELG